MEHRTVANASPGGLPMRVSLGTEYVMSGVSLALVYESRVLCVVCVYVCVYTYSACSLAAHRTGGYNTEGSGAKFPANPTNLSQPNIGCWWILIPSTRRTISHLYTDLARAREREAYPPRLFSPTSHARVRNARCSLSLSLSLYSGDAIPAAARRRRTLRTVFDKRGIRKMILFQH